MNRRNVMAQISFKSKIENVRTLDGVAIAYRIIRVPSLERRHCDMTAFEVECSPCPMAEAA
jgi:hypothetical protein